MQYLQCSKCGRTDLDPDHVQFFQSLPPNDPVPCSSPYGCLGGLVAVTADRRPRPTTKAQVLDRYPCLVGHMICESLGYFTPEAAALALLAYIEKQPFSCEWYTHMGGMHKGVWPTDEKLLQVGRSVVERAFRGRHRHRGYMAHYPQAKALVDHVRAGGKGPIFASWF